MGKNKYICLLGALLISLQTFGQVQTNRYVVHFTDKNNSPYAIDRPSEFLSERAIDRRARQQISITEKDLPVNPAYRKAVAEQGALVYYSSRWFNAVLIESDSSTNVLIDSLEFVRRIEYVAPGNPLKHPAKTENSAAQSLSSSYSVEKQLSSTHQNRMLGADRLHEEGFHGEGMLIAVCDGGFSNTDKVSVFRHMYNDNRLKGTFDFTRNDPDVYNNSYHGTQAFSCIGGFDEQNGFTGTAYAADFMLFVTEAAYSEYRIEEYNWLFAAEFADSAGVDVINTSLGYSTFDDPQMNYTYKDMDGNSTVISRAADFAAQSGILVVISAGNEGNKSWRYLTAPADADSVLTVGAVTKAYERAFFSSLGPTADGRTKPEVAALGYQTVVGSSNGGLTQSNGTSFAAPLITGLAAITWQKYPNLNNMEIIEQLKMAGHNSDAPNDEIGYGVPNFYLEGNDIYLNTEMLAAAEISIFPNPVRDGKLFLKGQQSLRQIEISLHNTTGQSFHFEPQEIDERTLKINISDLQRGVYFLKVSTPQSTQTIRLLKF